MTFQRLHHQNSQADTDALRELAATLLAKGFTPTAVEIGAWAGATTIMLADMGYRVYAVDHWQGNPNDWIGAVAANLKPGEAYDTFLSNVGPRLYRTVFPVFGSSQLIVPHWDLPINLLFIDGSHEYEDANHDIYKWSPKVHGLVIGHDYGDFPGVTRAVNDSVYAFGPFERAGKSLWWRKT